VIVVSDTSPITSLAAQQGYLAAVQPVIDELIVGARFRVSRALYQAVLKAAGESQP